jgi:hypothetical protein
VRGFSIFNDADHYHLQRVGCRDGKDCQFRNGPDMYVAMGPITGMTGVAKELMRHLGYDPAEHGDILDELAEAIAEEMLDTGKDILAQHGLPVRDSVL